MLKPLLVLAAVVASSALAPTPPATAAPAAPAAPAAAKGPPLLCFPIDIGDAKSLPFGRGNFELAKDYDASRLVPDTLALLKPEIPTLVRMETIRRATIYALGIGNGGATSRERAYDLLARVVSRAYDESLPNKKPDPQAAAAAAFDAAYLTSCMRQADRGFAPAAGVVPIEGGYAWLGAALDQNPKDAAAHLAAAIITVDSRGEGMGDLRTEHQDHVRVAAVLTAPGSLVAKNLVSRYTKDGKGTLESLRAP